MMGFNIKSDQHVMNQNEMYFLHATLHVCRLNHTQTVYSIDSEIIWKTASMASAICNKTEK